MKATIKYFLISIILAGCTVSTNDENLKSVEAISYGTSFGECLGYCIHEMTIEPNEIGIVKKGWDMEGALPEKNITVNFTQAEFDSLFNSLDFSKFQLLDTIIGCPDCADGGAEWVEVISNAEKHKVVFEYYNEPEEIKQFVKSVRNYFDSVKTQE